MAISSMAKWSYRRRRDFVAVFVSTRSVMADRHQPLTSPLALYALRVEGQNFKWVLYDTHDLSASAGGSRLLVEALQ